MNLRTETSIVASSPGCTNANNATSVLRVFYDITEMRFTVQSLPNMDSKVFERQNLGSKVLERCFKIKIRVFIGFLVSV